MNTSDDPRAGATRLAGAQALETALTRLPIGEQLFWVKPGAASVDGEAQSKLATPPDDVRKEVKAICDARGLDLHEPL
ncbi:MAG: hypothetical protein HYV09_25090 [Deltaproteobacteria bacterium]|nr:hypothetical protein [Deltaproteobacteria bacterium]